MTHQFQVALGCSGTVAAFNACTTDACRQFYLAFFPSCFANSSKSSASAQISATSVQQIATISGAVSGRLLATGFNAPHRKTAATGTVAATGLAAGGSPNAYNVWANLGQVSTAYSGNAAVSNADKFSSTVTNMVTGFDYGFASGMVVGLSLAVDRGNGTSGRWTKPTKTSGLSYAPYFGWQLSRTLALDAMIGLGDGKLDVNSFRKADSRRSFGAVNLAYGDWLNNLQIAGKAGYLVARESFGDMVLATTGTDPGTSYSNTLSQLRIAGEVGYWMDGAMPFVALAYTTDGRSGNGPAGLVDISTLGRSAFVTSLGVNFFSLARGVTGGLLYTWESGRSNGKNDSLSVTASDSDAALYRGVVPQLLGGRNHPHRDRGNAFPAALREGGT